MRPGLRNLALTVHIACSVGWIGAVAAYLVLDLTVATTSNAQTLRASYLGMGLIAESVIRPLAFAALLTGIVQSLGTKWGLFRHYWVLISLLITVFAVTVLQLELSTIRYLAEAAANPGTLDGRLRALGNTLVHSAGGMVVLLVVTFLNVYKPRGLTRYGWRKQQEARRRKLEQRGVLQR